MKVKCPRCYAAFQIPETANIVTCPYCGLVFALEADRVKLFEEGHFYFPLAREDPLDLLLRFAERQFAAPSDVRVSSTQVDRKLHYIPVHFYYLYARAAVDGSSKRAGEVSLVVEELDYVGIPATRNYVADLLHGYPFPIRGKKFFDEGVKRMGIYYEPVLREEAAKLMAEEAIKRAILREARNSVSRIRDVRYDKLVVDYRGLVHYPVWEISYRYGGTVYRGFIDGTTGAVIEAEHPQTVGGRAMQVGLSALMVSLGIISFILAARTLDAVLPGIFGFISGAAAAIPPLTRATKIKARASEVKELKEGNPSSEA